MQLEHNHLIMGQRMKHVGTFKMVLSCFKKLRIQASAVMPLSVPRSEYGKISSAHSASPPLRAIVPPNGYPK